MARADSTVRVNIIGDASSLQDASRKSDKALGGIGKAAKIAGGAIIAGFAVDAVLDFAQTALSEADRIGDASARLEAQLGDLSGPLIDAAGHMEDLGQSRQDVLELEAAWADMGRAAHLSSSQIAEAASPVAEAGAALALLGKGGGDAATVVDLIGKAARGSKKPLADLGIDLDENAVKAQALHDTGKKSAEALTDNELAAARLKLIMEKLAPQIGAVTDSSGDLEQKQNALQAKFETLTGRIGEGLQGPLTSLLDWILSGIDGLSELDVFMGLVDKSFRDFLGPAARVADALAHILNLIDETLKGFGLINSNAHVGPNGTRIVGSPSNVTVTVQGGSPEVIEAAVKQAVIHAQGTGSLP